MKKQVQKKHKTSEFRIGLISKSDIINSSKMKKIVSASDLEIKQVLSLVFIILGLKFEAGKIEGTVLLNWIRTKLAKFSLQDFLIAFELGIQKKLDFDVEKHYHNFSAMYLQNVMESYNRYRFKILKENQTQLELKHEQKSPAQKNKIIRDIIIDQFYKWQKNKNFQITLSSGAYDYLKIKGQMEWLTEDRKAEIQQSAEAQIKFELREQLEKIPAKQKNKKESLRELLVNFSHRKQEKKKAIVQRCKEIALIDYFKLIDMRGENLKHI